MRRISNLSNLRIPHFNSWKTTWYDKDKNYSLLRGDSEKEMLHKLNTLISDLENKDKNISIVASGDPTFYGITNYIKSKSVLEIEVIPGLSSFQYLTCKLKMTWNNAHLGSLHGRSEEFLEQINNSKLSIWLTDKEKNPSALCKILHEAKIKCKVVIGENLSYKDEIISEGIPKDFINKSYSSLSVFMVYKFDE